MSIARSSLLFSSGTVLSRLTGLIRDMVVAAVFGASVYLDAFIVAMRVPGLLREMLAEGSLGSAFTKVFTQIAAGDEERAKRLLQETFALMALVSVILCALGIVLAPWIVDVMTANAGGEHGAILKSNATGLARLLFPMLGVFMLGAVTMGALHQQGRFFLTAVAPISFNLGYVFGALVLAKGLTEAVEGGRLLWLPELIAEPAVTGLALGVLIGATGQLLVQWVGIRDLFRSRATGFRLWPFGVDLKHVFALMAPMVLAASAGQINQIVNTIFATSLEAGAVSWLNYAFRLLHLPIGVFGVAIGVAALPAITRKVAEANGVVTKETSRAGQNAVDLVLWLMAPCMVFYLGSGEATVRLLFQSGRFTAEHAQQTGAALFAYSFALIAYGLTKVFTSFYFALDRTGYAMRVSLFSILVNFGANYVLVDRLGHVGLAAAFATTLSMNALLLGFGLRREAVGIDRRDLGRSLGFLTAAGFVALLGQWGWSTVVSTLGIDVFKVDALIRVVGAALIVGAAFAVLGLLRLRMGPRAVLAKVRRRR